MKTVRLWTVGNLTDNPLTSIIPSKETLSILRSKIFDGGDIVVGPEVSVKIIPGSNLDKVLVPVKIENGVVLYRIEE